MLNAQSPFRGKKIYGRGHGANGKRPSRLRGVKEQFDAEAQGRAIPPAPAA